MNIITEIVDVTKIKAELLTNFEAEKVSKKDALNIMNALHYLSHLTYGQKWTINKFMDERDCIVSAIRRDVTDAVIDGKPQYSNDAKRQAEIDVRLSANEKYAKLNESIANENVALHNSETEQSWFRRAWVYVTQLSLGASETV